MFVSYVVIDVVQWGLEALFDGLLRVLRADAGVPRNNEDLVWY
jgi:hypothetical protein